MILLEGGDEPGSESSAAWFGALANATAQVAWEREGIERGQGALIKHVTENH